MSGFGGMHAMKPLVFKAVKPAFNGDQRVRHYSHWYGACDGRDQVAARHGYAAPGFCEVERAAVLFLSRPDRPVATHTFTITSKPP